MKNVLLLIGVVVRSRIVPRKKWRAIPAILKAEGSAVNHPPTIRPRTAHYDTAWRMLEYWASADHKAVRPTASEEEAHQFLESVAVPQTLVVTDAFAGSKERGAPAAPVTPATKTTQLYAVTGVVDPDHIDVNDGGQSMVTQVGDDDEQGGDDCFFIRLQSWDESVTQVPLTHAALEGHRFFRALIGKKVRVAVEVIDDEPTKKP
jgi:hypothetical protein